MAAVQQNGLLLEYVRMGNQTPKIIETALRSNPEAINYIKIEHVSMIDFLSGEGMDNRERYLSDLWKKGNFFLETCHDYIQWMFPLNEKSKHNSKAPVLTDREFVFIRNNGVIREHI